MSSLRHILLRWVFLAQPVASVKDNPQLKTDRYDPWQPVASFTSHVLCLTEADRRTMENIKRFAPSACANRGVHGGAIVSFLYRCVAQKEES